MVGVPGLEPGTPSLSEKCSNQLSYTPIEIEVYRENFSKKMERVMGLEPTTVCLEGRDSSHWATPAYLDVCAYLKARGIL